MPVKGKPLIFFLQILYSDALLNPYSFRSFTFILKANDALLHTYNNWLT